MDCQWYHSHKQINILQFIHEIHAVRVICIQGQTHSQQLRYPKSTYLVIAQTKNDMVKRTKNLNPTIKLCI